MKALLLAAAIAQPAAAAPAPPPTPVSELVVEATKMVSELIVPAKLKCLPPGGREHADRPRVMRTFPARGGVVRPGLLVVRITFNQPMACEGHLESYGALANPCPGDIRMMLLSLDRKTVRTVCEVEPGRQYAFSVGQDPLSNTFMGLSGLPTAATSVTFSTSQAPPISDVCEALAQDAETAANLRRRGRLTCAEAH